MIRSVEYNGRFLDSIVPLRNPIRPYEDILSWHSLPDIF